MRNNVIYGSFENKPYIQEIFKKTRLSGLKVHLFSGISEWAEDTYDELFHIIPLFKIDFCMEEMASKNDIKLCVIDSKTIEYFTEAQLYFNRLVDRIELNPSFFRQREAYFIKLITLIYSHLIEKKDDTIVIWREAPHSPPCIVLFFVCKFLGIPFFFPRCLKIDSVVEFINDFRPKHISHVDFSLPKISEDVLFKVKGFNPYHEDDGHFLTRAKIINRERTQLSQSRVKKLKRIARRSQRLTIAFIRGHFARNELYNLSRYQILKFHFKFFIQARNHDRWLELNSIKKIPNAKFVYFPLHFQPEKTTDPDANIFTHQHIALRMLSSALPEGYLILVKEHPRQYLNYENLPELNFRSLNDLEQIKSIEKVQFVCRSIDSEKLIKNSSIVCGLTGSSMWEALLNFTPSLSFCPTWHDACQASPFVETIDQLEGKLKKLFGLSKKDVRVATEQFLQEHEFRYIQTTNMDRAANASAIQNDILADRFVSVVQYLSKTQPLHL